MVVRPGIVTVGGISVPVVGGPWIVGLPPAVRTGTARLYSPLAAAKRTTAGWVPIPAGSPS